MIGGIAFSTELLTGGEKVEGSRENGMANSNFLYFLDRMKKSNMNKLLAVVKRFDGERKGEQSGLINRFVSFYEN